MARIGPVRFGIGSNCLARIFRSNLCREFRMAVTTGGLPSFARLGRRVGCRPYANMDGRGRPSPHECCEPGLRVLWAVAGLGEIAVGAVLHGVGITMPELALHGVVAALAAFVRLLRTLSAVGIIEKMIAFAFRHGRPFGALINNDYTVRLRRKLAAGNVHLCGRFGHASYCDD